MEYEYLPLEYDPIFSVGEIVTLKSGFAPQRILEYKVAPKNFSRTGWMVRCEYVRNSDNQYNAVTRNRWRPENDYQVYNKDNDPHKEKVKMAKLYETKDNKFGTLLAKNSAGLYVLEMKGTGAVEAYDPDELEEVKPYTVSLRDAKGDTTSYEAPKDKFKVGDVLINQNGMIVIVTAINTGAVNPKSFPEGTRRLVTEEL